MVGVKKPSSNSSRHSLRCATLLSEEGKSLPCAKGGAEHREAEGLYQTAKGGTTIFHYSLFTIHSSFFPQNILTVSTENTTAVKSATSPDKSVWRVFFMPTAE